jgi:ankyrin repeat protein
MNKYVTTIILSCFVIFNSLSQDIFEACRKGDVESIKLMIKLNPDTVNCRNEGGFTPLIIAGYRNQIEVVKLLLKHKADINALSGEGTVLMGTCYKGNLDLAKLLLKHGADVNSPNELGTTPLMYAILGQNIDLIKLLLDNGAKKDVVERSGKTANDYATQSDNQEIIELLK